MAGTRRPSAKSRSTSSAATLPPWASSAMCAGMTSGTPARPCSSRAAGAARGRCRRRRSFSATRRSSRRSATRIWPRARCAAPCVRPSSGRRTFSSSKVARRAARHRPRRCRRAPRAWPRWPRRRRARPRRTTEPLATRWLPANRSPRRKSWKSLLNQRTMRPPRPTLASRAGPPSTRSEMGVSSARGASGLAPRCHGRLFPDSSSGGGPPRRVAQSSSPPPFATCSSTACRSRSRNSRTALSSPRFAR